MSRYQISNSLQLDGESVSDNFKTEIFTSPNIIALETKIRQLEVYIHKINNYLISLDKGIVITELNENNEPVVVNYSLNGDTP